MCLPTQLLTTAEKVKIFISLSFRLEPSHSEKQGSNPQYGLPHMYEHNNAALPNKCKPKVLFAIFQLMENVSAQEMRPLFFHGISAFTMSKENETLSSSPKESICPEKRKGKREGGWRVSLLKN